MVNSAAVNSGLLVSLSVWVSISFGFILRCGVARPCGDYTGRGAWQATVHGVTKSLRQLTTSTHTYTYFNLSIIISREQFISFSAITAGFK